ncbi:uncharacterized protein LOC109801058 isoform X2 [Cajanus cajan]|nr:uncharacterized protein LOC109801058 isoform X2 [Cajanus cajan]XP_029127640.1 uncharacterized protein LOC109801058 isoform X2 [Cajanus cajan]
MSIYKLRINPASDEGTCSRDSVQVETTFLSQDVVPEADSSWLGKFQIHSSEGIVGTWDGIQAHLSNCSSSIVVKMASRLPKIIILEELPRLRLWPSQFMANRVTEDNIGLFFYTRDDDSYVCYKQLVDQMIENDLALKGNVDGIELLIFPSNVLPERSQRWNRMFFLWGVFRGRKVNISATTPVSNSLKLDNGDAAKGLPFDLNAYPQDGDDEEIVDKIPEFDLNAYPQDGDDMEIVDEKPEIDGIGGSGERVLVVGENSNSKGGEVNAERAVIDINVPLCPESGTPENGSGSVGVEDNNNVEVPLTSLPHAPPSTILDPIDWKAVDDLIFFSKGKF